MLATADGFSIEFSGPVSLDERVIVERQVFGQFWWRGIVTDRDAESGSFEDAVALRRSASVRYRVKAFMDNGETWTADCSLITTPGFSCEFWEEGDEIKVSITDAGANADREYVVRRTTGTDADAPAYWRYITTDLDSADSLSPTGLANYRVWARDDHRIAAAGNCERVVDDACEQAIPAAEALERIEWQGGDMEQNETLAPDGHNHYMSVNGILYYGTFDAPDGFETALVSLDPETGEETFLTGFAEGTNWSLNLADHVGGVYYTTADGVTIQHWYFSNGDASWVPMAPVGESASGIAISVGDGSLIKFDPTSGLREYSSIDFRFVALGVDGEDLIARDQGSTYFALDLDCFEAEPQN